jgi:polyhydroxyalkanoate synthesis regulator phasin
MDASRKRKVAAGTVAAVALAGGGGAIAATKLGSSPSEESTAVVNDAAKQLGIEPSKLTSALKKALEDRVDAAVAAGRLTKAQGEELKQRIESDDFPLFGPPFLGFGFAHIGPLFHGLDAAADYLGLTESELRTQLNSGKTLAEIAKSQDKSVAGLIAALKADTKKRLDEAVAAGRLTKADEERILSDLDQRLQDLVNAKLTLRFRHDHRPFPGFGGPPPLPGGPDRPQAAFPGI